jgi:hypothetical protein
MYQDGASVLSTSRAGDQDGASAPTRHPSSPRPYGRSIWHTLVGGTRVCYYIDYSTGDVNYFEDVLAGCEALNLLGC